MIDGLELKGTIKGGVDKRSWGSATNKGDRQKFKIL